VKLKLPLSWIGPESNDPSLAVTVWFEGPALVHVSLVPTVVFTVGGAKLKSWILSWVTGVGVPAAVPEGAGSGVDVAKGVRTVEFGTAGPEASTLGGPGVSVDEMRIGLGVGESAGAAAADPQADRSSPTPASARIWSLNFRTWAPLI
jgi:hypothetical protein